MALDVQSNLLPDSLVKGLTKEHQELVELYSEILGGVTKRKYGSIPKYATILHDQLHSHIHVENVKLYAGLKNLLEKEDPNKRQMVHGLQRELFAVGRAAIDFIRHAESVALNDRNADQFRTELEGIGAVLVRRIKTEENVLFPLFLEHSR